MNDKYFQIEFIKKQEGLKLKPYVDTVGKITIGYGRNLTDVGITKQEAEIMLYTDLAIAELHLKEIFSDYDEYPLDLKIVLTSMIFNLGKTRFLTFKKFIKAIKEKDYKKAILESVNSKRYLQIPNRVEAEIALLKNLLKENENEF